METIINIVGGTSGTWAICWLINKIHERNFCKKAGKHANHNYIELQKAIHKT